MFFALFVVSSCGTEDYKSYDDDCSNFSCITTEPFYTNINIKFTRTNEQPNPTIYIMTGNYGEGNVFRTVHTDSVANYLFDIDVQVPINTYYTVFTRYIKNNDTITALDGDFVYKESYEECGYNCWKIKNRYFNINLKN